MLAFLVASSSAAGLELTPAAIVGPLRHTRLLWLTLALNFVVAPLLAWLLTKMLPLAPGHALGLVLLGGAAGAPFLPKLAASAGSSMGAAVAMMILLVAGSLLFMPLALPLMIPGFQAGAWAIARPLVFFMLVPLLIGIFVKSGTRFPAEFLARALGRLGSACLLLLFLLLIILHFQELCGVVGSGAIFAMTLYLLGLFVVAWLLGGGVPSERGNLALATSARNFGAAMVCAAESFRDPDVVTMLIVGAVVCLVICFSGASWLRRKAASASS